MTRNAARLLMLFAITLCALVLLCGTRVARRADASSGRTYGLAAAAPPQAMNPAEGGQWQLSTRPDGTFATQGAPVHISLLPDGRLLYWGRDKDTDGWDVTGRSNTYLVDPLYLDDPGYTASPSPTPSTNLFCSGHSFLPDGRLLVTGGHIKDGRDVSRDGIGEKSINVFDYRPDLPSYPNGKWTRMPPAQEMEKGRWYPYNVTLANGETLIIAGTYDISGGTGAISTDDNKQPSVRDLQGNISTLLRNSPASPRVYTYPYLALAPDGRVFIAKPATTQFGFQSLFFDPYAPNGSDGNGVFTNAPSPHYRHWEGTSVMYAPGKMMLIGGSEAQVNANTVNVSAVETFDMTQPASPWSTISPMAQPRQYATATLLPDGKVLVTGGTTCGGVNRLNCGPGGTYGGAVQTPELWDPENSSQGWKQMNPTTSGVPRVYHSFALLLPDARVLVGGGGLPAAAGETAFDPETGTSAVCAGTGPQDTKPCRHLAHKDVEIFSPPYLFDASGNRAVRPSITSAPDYVAYGSPITIGVGNATPAEIKDVVLIRLPSVTHTYNQDQRRVSLGAPIGSSGDLLTVNGPANGTVCPPGPYMLFLIKHDRGTPSVAKIVRVGGLALQRSSQVFPIDGSNNNTLSVTATSGVSWTAQSDASWLTVTCVNSAQGACVGQVKFNVAPNNGVGAVVRKGTIRVSVAGYESSSIRYEFNAYQAIKFSDVNYNVSTPEELVLPNSISNIYARGITTGIGGGQYGPGDPVNRAQMATFLTRALRGMSVPPAPLSQRFMDVPIGSNGHWAQAFIDYVARRGISTGYGNGFFGPEDPMTRWQMAVSLCRALGVTDPPAPQAEPFSDVPLSHPYVRWIAELKRRGITQGCGNNNFCPDSTVTRGEMAIFLVRAFGL